MKYEARGQFVFDPESIVSVAAAENRVEAERFAAELNRLSEERDALLAACRAIDEELRILAAQGRAREKPSLDVIGQVRVAIAKAEGGVE